MGGLSSGVVQAKYARQQNELEEKKLENQAKQLDLNTQILENQIADQAAPRALTETLIIFLVLRKIIIINLL